VELSPERKGQIEAEERQRLAEEQYRAQVRAGLSTRTGPSAPQSEPPGPRQGKTKTRWGFVAFGFVVVMVLVYNLAIRTQNDTSGTGSPVARPRYSPASEAIVSGNVAVQANGYADYRFQITPGMRDARLIGTFTASGGSANDIEAVVASEAEFSNWINGHQAHVFYSTQGKKTTDTFDVRLGPGVYHLAFNNRFSAFAAKNLSVDVNLNYQQLQPY
jgi:hypothetical protein